MRGTGPFTLPCPEPELNRHGARHRVILSSKTQGRQGIKITHKMLPFKFRSYEIKGVPVPQALKSKGKKMFCVDRRERSGEEVRVTNHERTLVDCLDRPELVGSWEEIWRSLESVEFFDLDQVVEYVLLLENATTVAKVGLFLEQHREALMVNDTYLQRLRDLRPRQPHYLERSKRQSGQLVKDWNLVVPKEVLDRTWAEVL